MECVERFVSLSGIYRGFRTISYENLSLIKEREKKSTLKKLLSKHPFDTMKRFALETTGGYLHDTTEGKTISLVFGEFDEKMTFYPSITEKILKIHSVANLINGALKTRTVASEQILVKPLQDTLLEFFFLEKTFLYYAQKANLIDGKLENIVQNQKSREELFEAYVQTFKAELNNVIQACIDINHLNSKIKQVVFKDYSWMTYEVGNDGKVVNDYFLPKKYWEPFLKYMAAQQAEAMDQRKQ